ncbi:ABC transporter substrate-binding protein, partial [Pseudomonas syringae pv. tagetis]
DVAALIQFTPTQVTGFKINRVPVEYASPKEGGVGLNVAECTIANNSQAELAQKLAPYLLTQDAQAPALECGDQIPSNTKTET